MRGFPVLFLAGEHSQEFRWTSGKMNRFENWFDNWRDKDSAESIACIIQCSHQLDLLSLTRSKAARSLVCPST